MYQVNDLTEETLIDQYRIMHSSGQYGTSSAKMASILAKEIKHVKPRTILDYGCGQTRLYDRLVDKDLIDLRILWLKYDPAIEQLSSLPETPVDLVICTDVLEHIPQHLFDAVLLKIKRISDKVFFGICCIPAINVLPNGLNCHLTIEPPNWWDNLLHKHFPVLDQGIPVPGDKYVFYRTYTGE